MRRRGFTLIELLVVIAVLSLLAAILFPVLAKARDKGRQATCQSNLRQLSMSFLMYAEDYDELFPNLPPWYSWNGGNWATKVLEYAGSRDLFVCPSDSRLPSPWYVDFPYGKDLISYGYNSFLSGVMDPTITGESVPDDTGKSVGAVKYPSNIILVCETACPEIFTTMAYPLDVPAFMAGWYTHAYRHNEGDNFGFVDGHVRWYKVSYEYNGPDVYTDLEHQISFDYRYEP